MCFDDQNEPLGLPQAVRNSYFTECARNRGYDYPGERGLGTGGSLGLRCSERVTFLVYGDSHYSNHSKPLVCTMSCDSPFNYPYRVKIVHSIEYNSSLVELR
jgi:hypothetical protein